MFKLLKRDTKIEWTDECQAAFDKIKLYLLNHPTLVPPTPRHPLILYLVVQGTFMGCMLGQLNEPGQKEKAIYYLSKKFTNYKINYIAIEKTCCALAWASCKLRQYMLYFTTRLISHMDPIKYIFKKPALIGKISHWQMLLSEFNIVFMVQKAIKGQAIADYLADQPLNNPNFSKYLFPDDDVLAIELEPNNVEPWHWKLYFNGASNSTGSGVKAGLVAPKGQQIPVSVKQNFDCMNNVIEYEACIVGLQVTL